LRDVDVVVIGAGVVGLAVASALARAGLSLVILERDEAVARGVTSRNSEVVHAGLYYPAGSLKADLCVGGRERLYAWCRERGVGCRRLGKLVVASDESEIAILESLRDRGEANGVSGLALIDGATAARWEPDLRVRAALHSPESGIVDAHGLCLSLLADAEAHGAVLLVRHEVVALERPSDDWVVEARLLGETAPQRVRCGVVVNAAGLSADAVAALAGLDVEARGYRLRPCKGDYFALAPGAPVSFQRLVYPVPATAGLGIHATLDLAGRVRFGPDAEYVDRLRYDVDPAKAAAFADAVRRYVPAMRADWLRPDYAGIRPRLAGPGEAFRDFVVAEESDAGLPGLISCIGLESPGLTAALAIGDRVASLVRATR
jgi:L-2-hydroxyglutarate oxidase LhgO